MQKNRPGIPKGGQEQARIVLKCTCSIRRRAFSWVINLASRLMSMSLRSRCSGTQSVLPFQRLLRCLIRQTHPNEKTASYSTEIVGQYCIGGCKLDSFELRVFHLEQLSHNLECRLSLGFWVRLLRQRSRSGGEVSSCYTRNTCFMMACDKPAR